MTEREKKQVGIHGHRLCIYLALTYKINSSGTKIHPRGTPRPVTRRVDLIFCRTHSSSFNNLCNHRPTTGFIFAKASLLKRIFFFQIKDVSNNRRLSGETFNAQK